MGAMFGTEGGSIGDSFMDAPDPNRNSGKSRGGGTGENPISSLLNAVGIHVGETKTSQNSIEGKGLPAVAGANATSPASAGTSGGPVTGTSSTQTPGSTAADPSQVTSASLGIAAPDRMDVPPIALNPINVPKPSFGQSLIKGIGNELFGSKADTSSAADKPLGGIGGDAAIDGNNGKFGGGLGKAIMKVFSFG